MGTALIGCYDIGTLSYKAQPWKHSDEAVQYAAALRDCSFFVALLAVKIEFFMIGLDV